MANQVSSNAILANQVSSNDIYFETEKPVRIYTLDNPRYLPRNAFSALLDQDRVQATIESNFRLKSPDEMRGLVQYSIRNPWVFLTLVMAKLVKKMPLLRSGKFTDGDLPVRSETSRETGVKVYSVEHDQNRPWQCFGDGRDETNGWDWDDVDSFVSRQWTFFAVVLENNCFRYTIHRERPLPYVDLGVTTADGGHFGQVFKVGLRADHIKSNFGRYFPPISYNSMPVREVAVKQLRVDGATDRELRHFFEKEISTLETMRSLQHPHLIEFISAYEKGTDRCFVFPWAPGGNLRDLWRRVRGRADQQVASWAWDQIRGLADGLSILHGGSKDQGTRHGDVKPENILMFGSGDKLGLGQLVIADVGIAKFHADETSKRQVQGYVTTNKSGTLRYEPPEIELYKPKTISRNYDSWSLGCVLLEFIIWLVRGGDGSGGLEGFDEERRNTGSKLDRFWDQYPNGEPVLHPAARRWIKELLAQDLSAKSALQDLLKLVNGRLLEVSKDKRAYIQEFCSDLQAIHNKCSADPSYLWNVPDTVLTSRRESTGEVANNFVVPISQRPPLVDISECERTPSHPPITIPDITNIYQPRTSTLVDKWESVTDPSLARELLEGLKWTQWPGTRQLRASPCRLCRDCSAIDFASESHELQRSQQDLHRSADQCALCGFLDHRISALRVKPQGRLRLARDGAKIQVYPSGQPIASLYCDPVFGPVAPALPFAQLGLPLLPEPGTPEQFALLNLLAHHCNEKHKCMSAEEHSESPARLPTRVIDVGRDGVGPIRLVETTQEPAATGRYIALSHRWGDLSHEQRFCTYADNISQRKERIGYEDLPASFQDAVRVTRALGVRYLWIDSLCIIQEDREDWAAEAGRMEDVFSHAYCTIAASSASSSLAGFLGSRRPRDAIMLSTPAGPPLYLAEHIDDFRTDVENSVLSSRGWVLQERALSRRTIYFTSTQVYWECGNGVTCETLAQLRNPESRFLGDSNFPSFGLQFYKDERIQLVQHFYEAYSALALSHASDRSQAVAGLQRRIARAFGSAATYGVLWRWQERTLLWRAARPGALTPIDYRLDCGSSAQPPSWSWMAYDGRITFMDIPFDGVEWMSNVCGPADATEDGGVSAKASELCLDGEELMTRAILDVQGVTFDEDSWKCVLVGKEKCEQESDAAHHVLLIRPAPSSVGPSDDLYGRVGVATLLATHFSVGTRTIFIV